MVDHTPELSSDVEWRPDLRWHFIATRKRWLDDSKDFFNDESG
ncbi:hypothetical protein PI125_g7093 [Phytophthora idaei]|nr:hypothetical protein PI125_g7093 [Phytophthora idaei]